MPKPSLPVRSNFAKAGNLKIAITAALEAGKVILDIYHSNDFGVEIKDDNSPLTKADIAAHNVILSYLSPTNIPILSEEGASIPYETRKDWKQLWIVDPIDGTKEFIKRNGEFTVNIALIENQTPILGVIFVPVSGDLYFSTFYPNEGRAGSISGLRRATDGLATSTSNSSSSSISISSSTSTSISSSGSFKVNVNLNNFDVEEVIKKAIKLPIERADKNFTVVASRSHLTKETETYINQLREQHGAINIITKGSSLKFCMVAEGQADCYPKFGPTMEWDTAAGQAICEGAGCEVLDWNTKESILYNRAELLNNCFLVRK